MTNSEQRSEFIKIDSRDNYFVLLHLSDLHFFSDIEGEEIQIVNKIVNHLKDLIKSNVIPRIDVVVVSGDLTNKGKEDQFKVFGESMNVLADQIGITKERILFTCGNHDFDIDTLKNDEDIKKTIINSAQARDGATSPLINNALLNPTINESSYRALLEGTQKFYQFSKEYYEEDYYRDRIYRIVTYDICGNDDYLVNIALLNSSFINSGKTTGIGSERGLFSRAQISQVINDLEKIKKDYKNKECNISVYHHPFNYINDVEQPYYKDMFRHNFNIGLHGHIHTQENRAIEENFLEISAGALNAPEQKIIEANLVLIDFDESKIDTISLKYTYGSGWNDEGKKTYPLKDEMENQSAILEKINGWIRKNPPIIKAINMMGKQFSKDISINLNSEKDINLNSDEVLIQLYTKYILNIDGIEQKKEIFDILHELREKHPSSTIVLLGQAGAGKSSISSFFFKDFSERPSWKVYSKRQNAINIFIDLGKKETALEILGYLERFNPSILNMKVYLFFDSYDEYKTLIETTTADEDRVLSFLRKIKNKTNEWQIVLLSLRTNIHDMYKTKIEECLSEQEIVELKEIDIKEDKLEKIKDILKKIFSNSYLLDTVNIDIATDSIIKVFSENKDLPRLPIFIVAISYISLARINLNISRNGRYSSFLLFYNFAKAIHTLESTSKKINISFDQYVKEFSELAWYRFVTDEYDFFRESKSDPTFYNRMLPLEFSQKVHKMLESNELSPFINRNGLEQSGGDYAFCHDNFLRLFISIFIVTKLFSKNSTDIEIETVLSIPQRKDVTEFVTDYLNSLISNDNEYTKLNNFIEIEKVLDRLIKISENLLVKRDQKTYIFDINASSLIIYYLGRIKLPPSSIEFLKEFLTKTYLGQLEVVNKINKSEIQKIESKYKLWQLRNIMVSLMKLDDLEIEKEYFRRLFQSDVEREINIAYHQDYYLDIPVKEWYSNLFQYKKQFPMNTYEYLRRTLITYISNPQGTYFNLPYYTLLEIINKRLCDGEGFKLKDEILVPLAFLILIGSIAENGYISNESSIYYQNKSYLKSIIEEHFDNKQKAILSYYVWTEKESLSKFSKTRDFNTGKLLENLQYYIGDNALRDGTTLFQILQIYRLKDLQRSGWKKRGVREPESVADHIFSSIFLSSVLLHEDNSSENEIMKKVKVMQILMAHDLGESIIGDYLPEEIDPKKKEKEEIEAMKIISSKLFNKLIFEDFMEFSKKQSSEAKLANQIDKLDPIVQLLLYLKRTDGGLDEFFVNADSLGIFQDQRIVKFYELVKEFYQTEVGKIL